MISRRGVVLALGAGAFSPLASFAQQPAAKVFRIGFLGPTSASATASRVEAVRAGLRELGYAEGKNIVIEFRWAEGKYDRLPALAAELVQLKVDVIVTAATPGTRAAKQATTTIPVVSAISGDLVANGLVASLARPGGNVTGSTFFSHEIAAKHMEILKDALPRIRQVAVLVNQDNFSLRKTAQAMEVAAKSLKLELQQIGVREAGDFKAAFSAMAKNRVGAVAILDESLFIANVNEVAALALQQRLPSIGFTEFAEAGGLIGYGVNRLELYRRAAVFVDKILKGAKPGDIPIERATKFDMIVNLKTAKALGIKIPDPIMIRVDKVIE